MDVISVGEMLIDFTPGKEANSYVRNPGGAPANAVIAIARNGLLLDLPANWVMMISDVF